MDRKKVKGYWFVHLMEQSAYGTSFRSELLHDWHPIQYAHYRSELLNKDGYSSVLVHLVSWQEITEEEYKLGEDLDFMI